jgi:hypothetical protein
MERLVATRLGRSAEDPNDRNAKIAPAGPSICRIRWRTGSDRILGPFWKTELVVICDDHPLVALSAVRRKLGEKMVWSVPLGHAPIFEIRAIRERFGLNGSPEARPIHLRDPMAFIQDLIAFAADRAAVDRVFAAYQLEIRSDRARPAA